MASLHDVMEWGAEELLEALQKECNEARLSQEALDAMKLCHPSGATFLSLQLRDLEEAEELDLALEDIKALMRVKERLGGESLCQFNPDECWVIPTVSVDANGESYFRDAMIHVGPAAAGSGIGALSALMPGCGCQFRETPGDYDFDWHVAPCRQFVVSLDAAVEMVVSREPQAGELKTRVFPPGSIVFVEDTWGKGHQSRAVNKQPRKSVFIPVEDHILRDPTKQASSNSAITMSKAFYSVKKAKTQLTIARRSYILYFLIVVI
ncbi:unnamed protein product [Chrysoparadoxa australica]